MKLILIFALLILLTGCVGILEAKDISCGKDFSQKYINGILKQDKSICSSWIKSNAPANSGCNLELNDNKSVMSTRGIVKERNDRFFHVEPFTDFSSGSCFIEMALVHLDFSICREIKISPEEWEVDSFRYPKYVNCYTKLASKTADYKNCESMIVPNEYKDSAISYCKEISMYANLAELHKSSDFCELASKEIGEDKLIKKHNQCVLYVAGRTMDPDYCEEGIKCEEESECGELLDLCFFKVSTASFDKGICQKISDNDAKQRCLDWKDEPEIDILNECKLFLKGEKPQIRIEDLPVDESFARIWCEKALE